MHTVRLITRKLLENYALVIDPNKNPLYRLPPAQQFQIMVYLALMWTTIFCVAFGSWYWYGQLDVSHLAIILGLLITALAFSKANRGLNKSKVERVLSSEIAVLAAQRP